MIDRHSRHIIGPAGCIVNDTDDTDREVGLDRTLHALEERIDAGEVLATHEPELQCKSPILWNRPPFEEVPCAW